jgi:hypothetical protein
LAIFLTIADDANDMDDIMVTSLIAVDTSCVVLQTLWYCDVAG